jgi:2-iminobutanoate/2-iminopropanoate deaminase
MNTKEIATTKNAMQPTGPYSQGIAHGSLVFIAGQTAINPKTGELVKGTIQDETGQTLDNLKAVLQAAGSSLDKVLKTTVFLQDMEDFCAVNSVYAEFFPENPPARTCVEVSAMPKGAKVEIEAIAYR